MIIFDLDGTLADCEHRRHFVDSSLPCPTREKAEEFIRTGCKWKPNWKEFFEACDKDSPIEAVIDLWNQQISLGMMDIHQIWSGRCESMRDKTEKWLDKHLLCFNPKNLKMRPVGDNTPDDELKERWFYEYYDSLFPKLDKDAIEGTEYHRKDKIDFIFDAHAKSIKMWRRKGIFVFDCNQDDN